MKFQTQQQKIQPLENKENILKHSEIKSTKRINKYRCMFVKRCLYKMKKELQDFHYDYKSRIREVDDTDVTLIYDDFEGL